MSKWNLAMVIVVVIAALMSFGQTAKNEPAGPSVPPNVTPRTTDMRLRAVVYKLELTPDKLSLLDAEQLAGGAKIPLDVFASLKQAGECRVFTLIDQRMLNMGKAQSNGTLAVSAKTPNAQGVIARPTISAKFSVTAQRDATEANPAATHIQMAIDDVGPDQDGSSSTTLQYSQQTRLGQVRVMIHAMEQTPAPGQAPGDKLTAYIVAFRLD
ncbi:MAG: hypothetical protein WC058_01460 [Phycisphaeraceae bacterium]